MKSRVSFVSERNDEDDTTVLMIQFANYTEETGLRFGVNIEDDLTLSEVVEKLTQFAEGIKSVMERDKT